MHTGELVGDLDKEVAILDEALAVTPRGRLVGQSSSRS
jgi:hypothetical protein